MKKQTFLLPVLLAAIVVSGIPSSPEVRGEVALERYSGVAINLNSRPRTAVVEIGIERWSTDDERATLLAILVEEKDRYRANEKLRDVLGAMPKAGYIRAPGRLGIDLRYARRSPVSGGGNRIVVAADRPIGLWEARNRTRTMDYPFTVVEFRLDDQGNGEGKILAGTRLGIDEQNHLVLENYGTQPVRFTEVRRVK